MSRLWIIVTAAALVVSSVLNRLIEDGSARYAFLGFASALALIGAARALGSGLVERPEDYYQRDTDA